MCNGEGVGVLDENRVGSSSEWSMTLLLAFPLPHDAGRFPPNLKFNRICHIIMIILRWWRRRWRNLRRRRKVEEGDFLPNSKQPLKITWEIRIWAAEEKERRNRGRGGALRFHRKLKLDPTSLSLSDHLLLTVCLHCIYNHRNHHPQHQEKMAEFSTNKNSSFC